MSKATMRISLLLATLLVSLGARAQKPTLPAWIARLMDAPVEQVDTMQRDTSTVRRNGFIGTCAGMITYQRDSITEQYGFSCWIDTSRAVLITTNNEQNTIAFLIDLPSDVMVMAKKVGTSRQAVKQRISAFKHFEFDPELFQKLEPVPKAVPITLLGHRCEPMMRIVRSDTIRYWRSAIKPSPFLDMAHWSVLSKKRPFEVLEKMGMVGNGTMALRMERRHVTAEVTAVKEGPQAMPAMDLSGYIIVEIPLSKYASAGAGGEGGGTGMGLGSGSPGGASSNYSLQGRSVRKKAVIKNTTDKHGRVVMDIWVDREGKVLRTEQNKKRSTTLSESLVTMARKAAFATLFSAAPNAVEEQQGTITFDFVLE